MKTVAYFLGETFCFGNTCITWEFFTPPHPPSPNPTKLFTEFMDTSPYGKSCWETFARDQSDIIISNFENTKQV